MFNTEPAREASARILQCIRTVSLMAAIIVAVQALPGVGIAQVQAATPIDLFVQTLFGADNMDTCLARVRAGFAKAGYVSIADEPNTNAVKGVVAGGDTAGIVSMVSCIPSAPGASFNIALASAGAGSLGDFAPQTQNNRLLGAINNS